LSFSNGFSIQDLYDSAGLSRLDAAFLMFLADGDRALAERLIAARATPQALAAREESELLIAVAPHMEDFIARLFGIEAEVGALAARHHELAPLYGCKRQFVQRKAMHQYKA
jgi:hypothetical protein